MDSDCLPVTANGAPAPLAAPSPLPEHIPYEDYRLYNSIVCLPPGTHSLVSWAGAQAWGAFWSFGPAADPISYYELSSSADTLMELLRVEVPEEGNIEGSSQGLSVGPPPPSGAFVPLTPAIWANGTEWAGLLTSGATIVFAPGTHSARVHPLWLKPQASLRHHRTLRQHTASIFQVSDGVPQFAVNRAAAATADTFAVQTLHQTAVRRYIKDPGAAYKNNSAPRKFG